MKKSITKNYIYNLMYQVLVLIMPIITTPYISRVLGAENIGIYSYTLSISAYFILFGSLGIALYGKREIAYNQKDRKKYSEIFWEIILLRAITMIISLLIFYFVFVNGQDYQIYYRILVLEILASLIDISWFFQGLEEFKKTVTRNMIVKIISVICIFIFIKEKTDLVKYFWIYVLSILLGNGTLWLYVSKYLDKISFKTINLLRHLRPTLSLFIPQIAIEIYTLLDRTMIGTIIADKSEVGFYEQSQKIIKIVLAIITSLGTVMLPRIATNYADGNKKTVKIYMEKSFNLVFMLAFPMIFGIIAVANSFVPVFFGPGYDKVSILMSVISPIILFIGLSNVTGTQYLLPTKRQTQFTISVVCGAIVNLIMNSILIWRFGAIGASIGTIMAELTVTLVQMYYVREDFDFKKILKSSENYLLASLLMFFVCVIIGRLILDNKISTIVQVIVGAITYASVLLILKDKFVFEFIGRAKNKIKGE